MDFSPFGTNVREFAQQAQRRLYSAEALAKDILRGLGKNQAIIVAPASGRVAWHGASALTGSVRVLWQRRGARHWKIAHRGHVSARGAARARGASGLDRRAAHRAVLRRTVDVVQDLERGHRRREYLHVAARWRDDLAYNRT